MSEIIFWMLSDVFQKGFTEFFSNFHTEIYAKLFYPFLQNNQEFLEEFSWNNLCEWKKLK